MARLIHLARLIGTILRRLWPLVWKLIISSLYLCAIAVVGLFVGIPEATKRVVDEWMTQMVIAGFPVRHEMTLRRISLVFAYLMVAVGWITFVLLTDFAIRILL